MRLLLIGFLLAGCATTQGGPDMSELERHVDAVIEASDAETVAVALIDLESGLTLKKNADVSLHAASTMKVPVMVALFERIDRGELSLDQEIVIRNEFRSIADGSTFAVEDDSDMELHGMVGQRVTLENLMHRMIVRSSNLATNILIELAQPSRIMQLMRELGANDIRVLRGVEDIPAFEAGMNNTTTAWDLALVMRAIAEEKVVSPAASRKMLEILEDQEFRSGIPAGVPQTFRVANKTGSITRIRHDAAIVMPPGRSPYVLVVLTRGIADGRKADGLITSISRVVAEGLTEPSR